MDSHATERMMGRIGFAIIGGVLAASAQIALAQAPDLSSAQVRVNAQVPVVLSNDERAYYRAVFAALDREDWDTLLSELEKRPSGLLTGLALAEYYLHANSPRIELPQIESWLESHYDLPQAEQIMRLGQRRGLTSQPNLPEVNRFTWQGSAPLRVRPKSVDDGSMPGDIAQAIQEHIVNDDPSGARLLLDGIDASLSMAARAEWRQKVAWSYYIENQDASAYAMALQAREGSGPWVAEADWTAGLAAWRLSDCANAAAGFQRAAAGAENVELRGAANYWASRALVRCRKPGEAQEALRKAASNDETLYGMLAAEQLGQRLPDRGSGLEFDGDDWRAISRDQNVRIAAALSEIGEDVLADEVLRHQARIGDARDVNEIAKLARAMGLPSTQLYLAHNRPRGSSTNRALRYPVAKWQPANGWRVDPSLAFAHALQESRFHTGAISPAQARGLMQITPITVREHAPRLNLNADYGDLDDPRINLAFGQQNLEMLRDTRATEGKLPKIMAAYNAGLTPVTRWNSEVRDLDDPLLYMESIPYWETRSYVAIVMRNYWMYQRNAGQDSPARKSMAENEWPGFPGAARSGMQTTGRRY
ncbi:transglycosylase SLT domain-containing protein [Altererythrobacter sp. MF3-039]|uniref:transglycosylase SLT domain-containing protein n=1 Tax=Altererythrobacter sp. MF3-039 TaxID=3252901 RepID=UPI00390CAD17